MPHIHTEPNQHDMTVSAYILRTDGHEPKVLVHMHRKFAKLLQIGGHIELTETPWQTVAHEIAEESGYSLDELEILQPDERPLKAKGVLVHPVPVLSNTHKLPNEHYHSDFCYAFVAAGPPKHSPVEGESEDLRWLTMNELRLAAEQGVAGRDVYTMYEVIVERYLQAYYRLPAAQFSLEKPAENSI